MGLKKMMAEIGLDGSGFDLGAKRVESVAAKLNKEIQSQLGSQLMGIIGVAALEEAGRRTVEWGAKLSDLAKEAGLTAEAFQKMSYAFTSTGASQESMVSFLERLRSSRQAALDQPVGSEAKAFSRLGISSAELSSDSSEALMRKIGTAIKNGSLDQLEAPLREVGGRGAGALVAGFKAGIDEKGAELEKSGAIMSDAQAARMKQVQEEFELLTKYLAVQMVPVVDFLINCLEDVVAGFKILGAYLGAFISDLTSDKNPIIRGLHIVAAEKLLHESELTGNVALHKKAQAELDKAHSVHGGFGDWFSDAAQAASTEQAKQDAMRAAREAEARRLAALPPGEGGSSGQAGAPFVGKQTTTKTIEYESGKLAYDSLARIGGFVGGAESGVINIAREHLSVSREIASNTKVISDYINGVLKSTRTEHTGPLGEHLP
jgi:hypothetical protein